MDGVVIQGNCIVDAVRPALYFESPSTVTIANTVVRDHSCGGLQHMGGTIAMSNVQFEENRGYGVYLGGSSATLDGVGIADTAGGSDFEGIGLLAWNSTLSTGSGADPELEIEDSRDLGLVLSSGHASLDHVTITRSGAAGLAVIAANVELSHARISGTRTATERSWGGFGVYASLLDGSTSTRYAAPDPGAPVLTLRDSIIDDNEVAGIAVADGADALIDGVSVWSTRPGPSEEGDGLRALGDAFVTVEGLETSGNARASILYDGSAGSISASTGDEPIGVVVQDCLGVDQVVIDDDADFADVSMCDTGTPLPASISALTYSNDISVEE